MPDFPYVREWTDAIWKNFHESIPSRVVPAWLTLEFEADGRGAMEQQGAALKSILKYCFEQEQRLTILGSGWSLSRTVLPDKILLDPGLLNLQVKVPGSWLSDAYKATQGVRVPVVVGGGATIRQINHDLGHLGLALQTSGASDGHRVAGCVATGTHGADLKVGAVHDTLKALCLMVAPEKMVVVQPSSRPFKDDIARWFELSTKISTETVADDDLFRAAQVALGGLGLVYALVIEAVPLYEFAGVEVAQRIHDPSVWRVIEHLDASGLGGAPDPDLLALMLFPYARSSDPMGAIVSIYDKRARTRPYTAPTHATSLIATDTSKLIAHMGHLDGGLAGELIGHVITKVGQDAYRPGPIKPLFPGEMFGPTSLPPGNGASTEIVLRRGDAARGIATILDVLKSEAQAGRHHFGVCGVRFVAASQAHLAMNREAGTAFVEVAGLRAPRTLEIQRAVWNGLKAAGVPFACHFGQEHEMTPAQLEAYCGSGVSKWKAARHQLLDTPTARKVFTTPMLGDLNLA